MIKIGDKVVCIIESNDTDLILNKVYTVEFIDKLGHTTYYLINKNYYASRLFGSLQEHREDKLNSLDI